MKKSLLKKLICAAMAMAIMVTPQFAAPAMAQEQNPAASFEGRAVSEAEWDQDLAEAMQDPMFYDYYKVRNGVIESAGDTDELWTSALKSAKIPTAYKDYNVVQAIDVSEWQKSINWKKVKAAGVDAVIIRVGFSWLSSGNSATDSNYKSYINGAYAAGLDVGVYYFSTALTTAEAKREANYTLDLIKNYKDKITLPVTLDYEFNSNGRLTSKKAKSLGKAKVTEICATFCDTVRDAGWDPMIYASLSLLCNYVNRGPLHDSNKIWVAHWTTNGAATTYGDSDYSRYRMYMWQYSSSGKVSGISGKTDMDYLLLESKWEQQADGRYKYLNVWSGEYRKSQWIVSGNNRYYVDDEGYRVEKAFRIIDGKKYYFDENGIANSNKWITTDDGKYYLGSNGLITTGIKSISGATYYFEEASETVDMSSPEYGMLFVSESAEEPTARWIGDKEYTFTADGKTYLKRAKANKEVYIYANAGSGKSGKIAKNTQFNVVRTSGNYSQMENGNWIKTADTTRLVQYPTYRPETEVNYDKMMKAKYGAYTGPSTSYIKKATYKKNKKVTVTGTYGSWSMLSTGYWVPSSKLK